jgi:hypothetical protein
MCVDPNVTLHIYKYSASYNYKPYLEGKEIANLLKMARHMLMGTANV